MLFFLLIVSQLEINLYANKDTFLLGEDILVRWEIVNNGKEIEYYERNAELIKLTNDAILRNSEGKEVPHGTFRGMQVGQGSEIPTEILNPGDTIKFQEVNLIGLFGSLGFAKAGFTNRYIELGDYFLSLYYWTGKELSKKLWSDTLRFVVVEPTEAEKEAWRLYKNFKAEWNHVNEKNMVEYGYELLAKYPKSVYIDGTLEYLNAVFVSWGSNTKRRENMAPTTRKIVDYLEKNVGKFKGKERALKETVNCITHGELMLGTPKEEVKNKILQMKLPVSEDVMKVLEIKPEEIDTTKKK